ncbi:pyridoxamine 5'-phosphate oxidase family protein [Actinoplanes sp. NPDC051411]|uniref:pyridoxamine 5'-phosphate oxidase family protein n=1 Tax=Actinoplanes sp. NPDC051411 TaxID=3155522 RepID=UPI003436D824
MSNSTRPPGVPPRPAERRIADAQRTLRSERHLWLATAADGTPHLVPLAYVWNHDELVCVTKEANRSVRNVVASGRARAAVGTARDVVLVDATVTVAEPSTVDPVVAAVLDRLPLNPARVPGVVVLRLRPYRILAWRELSEMPDRVIMTNGRWLTDERAPAMPAS